MDKIKNLISFGWPQLYLAIYFGHDQIYNFNGENHIFLKIGSTTKSISDRIRGEAGQLSNIKLVELVGLCLSDKPLNNKGLLIQVEDQVRYLVREKYSLKYISCGHLSQENFMIPISKLEEFVQIFKESTDEIIKNYEELFSNSLEIISYDEDKKNFVYRVCPEITELYKEAYDVFCVNRNDAYTCFEFISEYIMETCPKKSEIYVKFEENKTRLQKKSIGDSLPTKLEINDLNRLGSQLKRFQRKGKDTLTIKSSAIQNRIKVAIEERSKTRKNREWKFSVFGKKIGDRIWFYSKNAKRKVECIICEGDTIQPLQYIFNENETQIKYAKATYINMIESQVGKQIRNTKGRNATQGWKQFFYEDENCTRSFETLKLNIIRGGN